MRSVCDQFEKKRCPKRLSSDLRSQHYTKRINKKKIILQKKEGFKANRKNKKIKVKQRETSRHIAIKEGKTRMIIITINKKK